MNNKFALTIKTHVRKDGAINITARGRRLLGIQPGANVTVTVTDGNAVIRPDVYVCPICGKTSYSPLNNVGICHSCDKYITDAYNVGGCKRLDEAMQYAKTAMNKAKGGVKL